MAAVEIVLLVCGIICIVVSFIFNFQDQTKTDESLTTELTKEQKDKIREQITQLIDGELEDLNEKTEASLDKISNTKILELNDYAENILGQINRNHNETVFLYDMLNEKAKEVKNTVRDVNVVKQQIEIMMQPQDETDSKKTTDTYTALDEEAATLEKDQTEVKDAARERLTELVKKSNEKSKRVAVKNNQAKNLDKIVEKNTFVAEEKPKTTRRTKSTTAKNKETAQSIAEEAASMNIQFEKGANNNDKILNLYSSGVSNKDIAKQLNLGVGEVKLVIDLYNGGK